MIVLHTMVVVIMDITLNHIHQLYLAGKSFAVVACPLQNIPESLDGYPKRQTDGAGLCGAGEKVSPVMPGCAPHGLALDLLLFS